MGQGHDERRRGARRGAYRGANADEAECHSLVLLADGNVERTGRLVVVDRAPEGVESGTTRAMRHHHGRGSDVGLGNLGGNLDVDFGKRQPRAQHGG